MLNQVLEGGQLLKRIWRQDRWTIVWHNGMSSKYLSFSFRPDCSVGVPLGLWSWSEWETYLLGLLQVAQMLRCSDDTILKGSWAISSDLIKQPLLSFPYSQSWQHKQHASLHHLLKKISCINRNYEFCTFPIFLFKYLRQFKMLSQIDCRAARRALERRANGWSFNFGHE